MIIKSILRFIAARRRPTAWIELIFTAPIAAMTAAMAHTTSASMPVVSVILMILSGFALLLCIDYSFGAPALRWFADWSWQRRENRQRREALRTMTRIDEQIGLL